MNAAPRDEPRVISGWSIDTLYTHLSRVDADAALLVSEHFRLTELRYIEGHLELKARQHEELRDAVTKLDAAILGVERMAAAAVSSSERAIQAALVSSEKAIAKAELATDKRFESVNEFRQTLADASSRFLTRLESDAKHETLLSKIATVSQALEANVLHLSRIEARGQGASALWGYLLAGVGVLVGFIGVFAHSGK